MKIDEVPQLSPEGSSKLHDGNDFSETELQLEGVNLHEARELLDLPQGLGWTAQGMTDANEKMFEAIMASIALFPNRYPHEELLQFPTFMTGFSNTLKHSKKFASEIIGGLLERYPNLQWMRGGSVVIRDGVAVFDGQIPGSDGALGNVEAVGYAYSSYSRHVREKPALLMVPLRSFLDTPRSIDLGSHHGTDLTITPMGGDDYLPWCAQNLSVYRLPKDPLKADDIKTILRSKAIVD